MYLFHAYGVPSSLFDAADENDQEGNYPMNLFSSRAGRPRTKQATMTKDN